MSLVDQVRKIEQQVMDRLKELEPLTREYDQLRKVAERLGLKYSPDTGKSSDGATRTRPPGKRAGTAKRTARKPARAKPAKPRAVARAAKPAAKPRGSRSTVASKAAPSAKASGASGTVAPTRPGKRAAGSGRRPAAARPGQRNEDVLRLVGESPGITVREIGERLGVDATGLYRVVNRLSDEGRLRKDGTRLEPVDSATAAKPKPEADTAKAAPASSDTETPEATPSSESEASPTVGAGAPSGDS